MKDDDTSIETLLEGNESELLRMANCGGLAIPTNYCFAVCTFAMQLYSVVSAEEEIKKKLLSLPNQRAGFIAAASKGAKDSEAYQVLFYQACAQRRNNFKSILQISFNFSAKNELKRLNKVEIELPVKMTRTIRKLTAKTSK